MSTFANASFTIDKWNEEPLHEKEGMPKMTRVRAEVSYRGDIEGKGLVEYLMIYRDDGTANFIGLEHIHGGVAGYAGGFVLQHAGSFENGMAKSTFTIVPGAGTDKLATLTGHGEYAANDCDDTPLTMQYDIDGVVEDRETAIPVLVPTGP